MTIRIEGPYPHKSGHRCRIRLPTGLRRWCPSAPTPEAALEVGRQAAELQEHEVAQSVGSCIEKYLDHHADKGSRPKSVELYRQTLGRFFQPVLELPIGRVTAARGASLYEQLRKSTSERTGRPLSVDYHRNALANARCFLAWCVGKRWIKANPLAEVRGVGAKRKGKVQPTIDEGRELWAVCLREAEGGDSGALAVAVALTMGLRAGEIVSRTVRDLDNKDQNGLPRILRVGDNAEHGFLTKTSSSKRHPAIPEELQQLLARQARDKLPGALLFPSATGGLQWASWVNRQTIRLCRLAKTPQVCAHSLRGFSATTAAAEGETPQVVARVLGHRGTQTTLGHYIQRGAVEAAELAQGLKVLRGGK